MPRPTNQELERYYFEQFRNHYRLPCGEAKYDDKPDVIIRGDVSLGIEIANFYIEASGPKSPQVQRRRGLEVIENAQALHRNRGGRNTELTVCFNPDYPIEQIESIASAIADLAIDVANLPSGSLSQNKFAHIPQLHSVYHNANEYSDAKWRIIQKSNLSLLSVDRLQELVSQKNLKAKSYQKCDAYWLLLVIDFIDLSQDQEIQLPKGIRLGKSAFEKVLLYKPQFAQIVEVPI